MKQRWVAIPTVQRAARRRAPSIRPSSLTTWRRIAEELGISPYQHPGTPGDPWRPEVDAAG